jgi:hypothetical protein
VFDLRKFPFDRQALVVRVSTTWDEKKLQFRRNSGEAVLQAFGDYNLQDYELTSARIVDVTSTDPRDGWYATRSDAGSSTSGARYSSAFLIQTVSRNPGFYLLNLYLPTFLISSCSFAAFAFLVDEFAGRSAILVTLLLTAVAFKQVIAHSLPRVPYITYLDRYVLTGLTLIIVVGIVQASFAAASICVFKPERRPSLCSPEFFGGVPPRHVDDGDHIALIVSSITWVVYHLLEMFLIIRAIHSDAGAGVRKEVTLGQDESQSVKLPVKNETKEEAKT